MKHTQGYIKKCLAGYANIHDGQVMQIFMMAFHNPKQLRTVKILIYGATGVVLKKKGSCCAFSPNGSSKMLS
jgi:hypothetical protein